MPPVTNPYTSDPDKAEVFEFGYLAGFQDPAGNDNNFRPLAPELLDVFVEGAEAGRADAHNPPGPDSSKSWIAKSDLTSDGESSDEAVEHLATFTIFKLLETVTRKAVFGLVDLVITVIGIQGNVSPEQLEPMPDDFSEDYQGPDPDSVYYVAACPRKDHVAGASGVAADGFWSGSAYHDFKGALKDAMRHEHREAVIARCDTQASTCGLVWPAR